MGDFNFLELHEQAKKIDEGLLALSEKVQNPHKIGTGRRPHNLLDEMEREVSANEEMLALLTSSLQQKLTKLKLQNNQRKEYINNIKSEVSAIEEIGKEVGFYIPVYELSRLNIDDISTARSPSESGYLETPLSSRSISHSSTPRF